MALFMPSPAVTELVKNASPLFFAEMQARERAYESSNVRQKPDPRMVLGEQVIGRIAMIRRNAAFDGPNTITLAEVGHGNFDPRFFNLFLDYTRISPEGPNFDRIMVGLASDLCEWVKKDSDTARELGLDVNETDAGNYILLKCQRLMPTLEPR
jgi:hypothetical protein